MTARADLIKAANRAAVEVVMDNLPVDLMDDKRMRDWAKLLAGMSVRAAVDAVLPQVTTVAQLEALPSDQWLIGTHNGEPSFWRRSDLNGNSLDRFLANFGPLTVWQPSADRVTT